MTIFVVRICPYEVEMKSLSRLIMNALLNIPVAPRTTTEGKLTNEKRCKTAQDERS
jgi:hypothetical protein